jgi:hypothetical protein
MRGPFFACEFPVRWRAYVACASRIKRNYPVTFCHFSFSLDLVVEFETDRAVKRRKTSRDTLEMAR